MLDIEIISTVRTLWANEGKAPVALRSFSQFPKGDFGEKKKVPFFHPNSCTQALPGSQHIDTENMTAMDIDPAQS